MGTSTLPAQSSTSMSDRDAAAGESASVQKKKKKVVKPLSKAKLEKHLAAAESRGQSALQSTRNTQHAARGRSRDRGKRPHPRPR